MDEIESIKTDKTYLKCKLTVKNWEKEFKNKYSRTPSRFDIKEAPSNIKYAYKKYFQLKSVALENSLSICDAEEEIIGSLESINSFEINESLNTNNSPEIAIPELPTACELDKLLSSSEKLSKKVPNSVFTENLSKKLFSNRKFSIRNPRKLSVNKDRSTQSSETFISYNDTLSDHSESNFNSNSSVVTSAIEQSLRNQNNFDIEKVNNEIEDKSLHPSDEYVKDNKYQIKCSQLIDFSQNLDLLISGDKDNVVNTGSIRQIDNKWLERATGLSCQNIDEDKHSVSIQTFGLRNVNIRSFVEPVDDFIENSASEDDDVVLSKLKPALKKRKFNDDCGHNNHKNIVHTDIGSANTINKSRGVKTTNKKLIKKTKNKTHDSSSDKPPDINDFLPFGLKENIIPRHDNLSDTLESIDQSKSNTKFSSQELDDSKLITKIQSGTLNENFVKINIEKKVFVRGKKAFNFSKHKKKLWKDKKALHAGMQFPEGGKINCFKCGSEGHMARYCTAHRENALLPLEEYQDRVLASLEDMQEIVKKETLSQKQLSSLVYNASQVPEHFLQLLSDIPDSNEIKPVFSSCDNNSKDLYEVLCKFNHSSFRPGQEEAIKRILCGKSTLLILSTGGGKSLCYQLPAFMYSQHYKCVTLVISPLVSLMEDQVLNMPEFLRAGCLHTNQQPTQRRKIVECLKNGDINILLISPEALIAGDTSNGFTGLFKSLPPIAFACIDEAHCVSQWSHNFRPSYLMICRVLREKLNVKCILGLTATASQTTIKSIIEHINVPDGLNGVLTNPALPNNLYLSMSFEKDKDKALVSLLASENISVFSSIIVYCIRRNECERVAAIIRSCLSQPGKINMEKPNNKRKRMSYIAEAYHAGMSASQRNKIQKHFMDGTLKVIVATVAFGMGINKSDIRCIIHYNMPPSFESYVQEVGRAGRDGLPAYCHVFLSNSSSDKDELLKHIYANSIDRPVIRKLLQKIFIPCKCATDKNVLNKMRCSGHEVGIPIDSTVEELDLPSENIATLLCYVELHYKHYIKVLNNAYVMCKISSYGGPLKLHDAAKTCPPLAMAYLIEGKRNPEVIKNSLIEFNIIEVAAAIGWQSGMCKYHLKNLEWITTNSKSQRSHLKVEFHTLGFKIKAPGDLSAAELDSMLDDLHSNVNLQETLMLYQLEEITESFRKLCTNSCDYIDFTEESLSMKSDELKTVINNYFKRDNNLPENITFQNRPLDVEQVTSDVRALIATYKDCKFTGRSIARIFQGITSPNYPALVWGRCKFWRSHLHEDFYGIVKIATQQIIKMKM